MVDKQYLHDGLNKEEKMIAYVLTWLLLPGRLNEDKMSTEDEFLLNAIKTRIPTNWVAVLKHHMIAAGDDYAHKFPYGVFISKICSKKHVTFTVLSNIFILTFLFSIAALSSASSPDSSSTTPSSF
ncbi:hypothetical protein LR48_Vigan10g061000 [Vigna angularis]|uniref:Uncharacterized protein n=1 Tax=Phaseolus angularis TaxID=3914 RepID=A0A0L9VIA6_PHAAN|nr:hypothetical protein LR48_Vigan10g061000 [Vigna angularis]